MEYIALGVNREWDKRQNLNLLFNSKLYDLTLLKQEEGSIDTELEQGVLPFIHKYNILLYKIIKLSTSNSNSTSSEVSQSLIDYFINKSKCDLIELILKNKHNFPKKFYLLFAFEWHKGEPCRFKSLKIECLRLYFLDNNSWYLWLYDFEHGFDKPDLDVPLVLEIENN